MNPSSPFELNGSYDDKLKKIQKILKIRVPKPPKEKKKRVPKEKEEPMPMVFTLTSLDAGCFEKNVADLETKLRPSEEKDVEFDKFLNEGCSARSFRDFKF